MDALLGERAANLAERTIGTAAFVGVVAAVVNVVALPVGNYTPAVVTPERARGARGAVDLVALVTAIDVTVAYVRLINTPLVFTTFELNLRTNTATCLVALVATVVETIAHSIDRYTTAVVAGKRQITARAAIYFIATVTAIVVPVTAIRESKTTRNRSTLELRRAAAVPAISFVAAVTAIVITVTSVQRTYATVGCCAMEVTHANTRRAVLFVAVVAAVVVSVT